MVLYFSATGNCKYVATRLAKAFDEESVSIPECTGRNRYVFEDKTIGVVSPTYFWGLPSIVKEFLEKASFKTEYLYFVQLRHHARRGRQYGKKGDTKSRYRRLLFRSYG